jgi:hypothetical protein
MRQVAALLAGLTPRRATYPRAPRPNSAPHHAAHPDPTTPDRALCHSATSPLPQDPDDPTPPNRPKGTRAKQTTSDPDAPPAPQKTYPPVQVINYLANSTPDSTAVPEPTAPHHALCHLTTSPLLRAPTPPLLPPPPAATLPDTEAPVFCFADFRFADFRRSRPRARSPSLPHAA